MSGDPRTSHDTSAIEDRLLSFVRRELLVEPVTVDRDTNLLSGELLDSMNVLRLATFVGEAFHIEIHTADFVVENFRNIAAIAEYVRRRLAESAHN